MSVREYIGARYVPKFADPIQWSNENTYEPLTIVLNEGNSYTSKQFVPVGIDISNEDFWALTGNYNAQIEQYRQEVSRLSDKVGISIKKFDTVADMLAYDAAIGETYLTLGYREKNDGGGNIWICAQSAKTNGMDIVESEGKYFVAVVENDMVPEQFGAVADGTSDDSLYINRAYELCKSVRLLAKTYYAENISAKRIEGQGKAPNGKNSTLKLGNLSIDIYSSFKNMIFDGEGVCFSGNPNYISLNQCRFTNFNKLFNFPEASFIGYINIANCDFVNVENIFPKLDSSYNINYSRFDFCTFTDVASIVASTGRIEAMAFDSCVFEGNTAIVTNANILSPISLTNPYIESSIALFNNTVNGTINIFGGWIYSDLLDSEEAGDGLYISLDGCYIARNQASFSILNGNPIVFFVGWCVNITNNSNVNPSTVMPTENLICSHLGAFIAPSLALTDLPIKLGGLGKNSNNEIIPYLYSGQNMERTVLIPFLAYATSETVKGLAVRYCLFYDNTDSTVKLKLENHIYKMTTAQES